MLSVGARMISGGHEIFEHRARPGKQRRAAAERGDAMSEPEPVTRRQVALGDGDKAREARFRGQQVVAAFVERAVADHEADREEQPLFVQEEAELHRQGHFPRPAGDAPRVGSQDIRRAEVAPVTGDRRKPPAPRRACPKRLRRARSRRPSARSTRVAAGAASAVKRPGRVSPSRSPGSASQGHADGFVELTPRHSFGAALVVKVSISSRSGRGHRRCRRAARGSSGPSHQSSHALASAMRCPARLPLSTEETYADPAARNSRVSYQL